jgi:hypothetical protein
VIATSALANASNPAGQDVAHDIAELRHLIPAGHDLAQVQIGLLKGTPESDALKLGGGNYLFSDFNGDGLRDVALIYEKNPFLGLDGEAAKPCAEESYNPSGPSCILMNGPRTLLIALADGAGYRRIVEKSNFVLAADEGGIWGDPLEGLRLNSKGSIVLRVYGGSAHRWWFEHVMQFRKGDFYVVGSTEGSHYNVTFEMQEVQINYITGRKVESKITLDPKTDKERRTEKVRKIPRKPLVRVMDATGPWN